MRCLSSVLVLLLVGACAVTKAPPHGAAPALTADPALDAFLHDVARALEGHDWDVLLDAADAAHYRVQVTEHGMAEPQYVAELFGLHRVGNSIEGTPPLTWSDLEGIEAVRLTSAGRAGGEVTVSGEVTLRDGRVLALEARVVERAGGFRLTGAVG